MVGSAWPAFSVPGMIRSGTIRRSRNTAVVVAKDPTPRASKKFVTVPSPICRRPGTPTSVAGDRRTAGILRAFEIAAAQPAIYAAVTAASVARRAVIGFKGAPFDPYLVLQIVSHTTGRCVCY